MRTKLLCVVVLICMGCMLFLTGCVVHFNGGNAGSTFDYEEAETYTSGGGTADADIKNDDLIMRWKLDGDTLRVKFCNVGTWKTNGLKKELTVTIPEGLELDSLEIETVSGHVTLAVPGRSDFAARYDTVSGEMESDVSLKKDGDKFICGNGKHTFRIDTTSGSLTILENK